MPSVGEPESRERKMTTAGLEYTLSLKKKNRDRHINAIRKLMVETQLCFCDPISLDGVRNFVEKISQLMADLRQSQEEYLSLLSSEEEKMECEEVVSRLETDVASFEQFAVEWLNDNTQHTLPPVAIPSLKVTYSEPVKSSRKSSLKSLSATSRRSATSLRSSLAQEKANLAALKAETQFLDKKKSADALLLSAKQSVEKIRLESEVAKAEARVAVLQFEENQSEVELGGKRPDLSEENSAAKCSNWLNRSNIGDQANEFAESDLKKPSVTEASPRKFVEYERISRADNIRSEGSFVMKPSGDDLLHKLLLQQSAPDLEIDMFNGDPLNFQFFIATFEEAVEKKIADQKGRLTRLIKYTSGEAKELIKGCIHEDDHHCYTHAKDLLKKRYGDPFRLINAYRREIREWPQLKVGDAEGFRKFYNLLVKCQSGVKSGRIQSELDSPDTLRLLQSKLPHSLQERWNRKVFMLRRSQYREVTLSDFVNYVDDETTLVNDPLFSKEASNDFRPRKDDFKPRKDAVKTVKANATSMKAVNRQEECLFCKKSHKLKDCRSIQKKTVEERNKIVSEMKLCFGCLKPISKQHVFRSCKRRLVCETCGNQHPTILHGFSVKQGGKDEKLEETVEKATVNAISKQLDEISEVTNACINAEEASCSSINAFEVISMSIVPVWLSHPDVKKRIKVYAMLDSCSQGTFVTEHVLNLLGVEGVPSKIVVKTLTGQDSDSSRMVRGLLVSSVRNRGTIELPKTYSRRSLPVDRKEIPTPAKLKKWSYLEKILPFCEKEDSKLPIGLIIGANCPVALEPLELIASEGSGPYAFRTRLGWNVVGPIKPSEMQEELGCHRIAIINENDDSLRYVSPVSQYEDCTIKELLQQIYMADFTESGKAGEKQQFTEKYLSQDDLHFMKIMKENVRMVNGHYQLPLPFKGRCNLPNNRIQAISRCRWIQRKLERNKKFKEDYLVFMNNLFEKGYARKVPEDELKGRDGHVWYLPHHGVYHPKKPDKIRVVFDASAEFKGVSLNKMLLQGPDLANLLLGVLLRFRLNQVAFMGDIEAMFYMVHVPPDQWDLLRFLWWPDGDTTKDLVECQMMVHIFGGISSPTCSNFALRKTASDHASEFPVEVTKMLGNDFYVDDLLKSVATTNGAIDLIKDVCKLCKLGGFHLTKFISNEREVIESIPVEDRTKNVKSLDLMDSLPIERALGVHWSIENDCLGFKITLKDTPLTKRGVLSTISSIYDPLGFAAPFLLQGKLLMQKLSKDKADWDSPLSDAARVEWEAWRHGLPELEKISVPRCIVPKDFGQVNSISLHHFSDGSLKGYGVVSYVRAVNDAGKIHCSILTGKSRVAPLRVMTVPRMELTAATVAVKVSHFLNQELQINITKECFWTDSNVVLGYIANDAKRFHIFVANRIQTIHDFSEVHQWNHVPTDLNPADDASKGLCTSQISRTNRWFTGPEFLWKEDVEWPKSSEIFDVSSGDKEIKKVLKTSRIVVKDSLIDFFERFSSWLKCVRVMALVLRYVSRIKCHWFKTHPVRQMQRKTNQRVSVKTDIVLDVSELEEAKITIFRLLQSEKFGSEIDLARNVQHHQTDNSRKNTKAAKSQLKKSSNLYRLNPILGKNDLLRVGGRLSNMDSDYDVKFPVILPKNHHISLLLIRWCHFNVAHCGRNSTLNEMRSNGLWIIKGNTEVKKLIHKCVTCRAMRGKVGIQIMSDLPVDRVNESPPFTYCGVDFFGPFIIKYGNRRTAKRYGCIFTCMACRAVHIEVSHSLETDSFIMVLRRFLARRGMVRTLRCDQGTNFIGAENELKKELKKMNQEKVKSFLSESSCQWIEWVKNPPTASHMGGAWERQIRTVRAILQGLLRTHGAMLTDESLHTLLVECECIINSRPLSVENISDPASENPLTPMMLLTMKTKVVPPPPGEFEKSSLYVRKRWKQVQHIANAFWNRWKKEYLQNLQTRQKWVTGGRNFEKGDVVLIKDEDIVRNRWKMGRIEEPIISGDGRCRSCKINVINNGKLAALHRPINKLVLLLENEH